MMKVGTKSLLFGVHQFIWHPITVTLAWRDLYGKWPNWKELICIVIHDWGYWGKPNMDGQEGGQREKALIKHGCNYYGKTVTRSCPFAIFSRQDLLQLALDLKVPVPEIYGEIVRDEDGTLRTTRAQRTGCTMCGFGIHIERRPHRFDRLREDNYKEWKFWMYDMGWGKVLDYIGAKWENEYIEPPKQGELHFAM